MMNKRFIKCVYEYRRYQYGVLRECHTISKNDYREMKCNFGTLYPLAKYEREHYFRLWCWSCDRTGEDFEIRRYPVTERTNA